MIDEKYQRRFAEKWQENASGCWIWTATKAGKGYGIIGRPGGHGYEYAHRLSWRIYRGEIPTDRKVQICHHCDTPACVNPEHLFLGDAHANHLDMVAKGRSTRGRPGAASKLTAIDVRKIKALLATNLFAQAEIGRMFGVHQVTISKIARGQRWAHISTQP